MIDKSQHGGRLTLGVDLDGVLAEMNPARGFEIGKVFPEALPVLKKFKDANWQIILYTVRPDDWLLKKWADKNFHGIFDAINCNPEDIAAAGIVSAKPNCSIYLDDKAWPNWNTFDWDKFEKDCINRGIIK